MLIYIIQHQSTKLGTKMQNAVLLSSAQTTHLIVELSFEFSNKSSKSYITLKLIFCANRYSIAQKTDWSKFLTDT